MKRVRIVNHHGKSIIYSDFTNLTILPKSVALELMNQVKEYVIKHKPNSALLLTNLTGLYYNYEIINLFKDFVAFNRPYVKASAAIDSPDKLEDLLININKITGRKIHLFESENEALDWLVNQ